MALEIVDGRMRCTTCSNPLLLVTHEIIDLKAKWDDFVARRPNGTRVEFARELDNTVPNYRVGYQNHPTYFLVSGLLQGPHRRRHWRRRNVIAKCPICGATSRLAHLQRDQEF